MLAEYLTPFGNYEETMKSLKSVSPNKGVAIYWEQLRNATLKREFVDSEDREKKIYFIDSSKTNPKIGANTFANKVTGFRKHMTSVVFAAKADLKKHIQDTNLKAAIESAFPGEEGVYLLLWRTSENDDSSQKTSDWNFVEVNPDLQPLVIPSFDGEEVLAELRKAISKSQHDTLEIFILQNNLPHLDHERSRDGQINHLADALLAVIETENIKFRCTLYHPESHLAAVRDNELTGEKLLQDGIRHSLKVLKRHLKSRSREDMKKLQCEFRLSHDRIPFTAYGIVDTVFVGWLVKGSESRLVEHIRFRGIQFDAVKTYFESFWSRCYPIDLSNEGVEYNRLISKDHFEELQKNGAVISK